MFDTLRERMEESAKNIALISDGCSYTYRELADEVVKNEYEFQSLGIGVGSVVVLIGEYSFKSLAKMLALFFCKATVVPLTYEASKKLEKHIFALCPDFLIDTYGKSNIDHFARSLDIKRNTEWRGLIPKTTGGLLVFTSGSTGTPKAIIHDIDFLCYRYLVKKEPLISICFLLFDHMGGLNTILFLLFRGGTAVNVSDRSVDTICSAIEQYKVQLLPATPSFFAQLLMLRAYSKYDLSSLKFISYGTEVMSQSVLRKMNEILPNCIFKQTYGLSETGVFQVKSRASDSLWFKFIDDGVETKVVDNVLWIKTKSNLLGKILFTEDGLTIEKNSEEWFCTNDLVETDNEYFLLLGRQTDIINVGGLKVYPSEVENCIHELPFINDVLVKSRKHPLLGQIVIAYILLDGTIEKLDAERLIKKYCQDKLERFKVPSQFIYKWDNFINDRFKKVRTQ